MKIETTHNIGDEVIVIYKNKVIKREIDSINTRSIRVSYDTFITEVKYNIKIKEDLFELFSNSQVFKSLKDITLS